MDTVNGYCNYLAWLACEEESQEEYEDTSSDSSTENDE